MRNQYEENDSPYFITLLKESKQYAFKVFYLILKDAEQNFLITLILSSIQLFQLIYLPFSFKLRYIWQNDDATKIINDLLSYFQILLHIMQTGFSVFLYCFYLFSSIIVLLLIMIIFVGHSNKKKMNPNIGWIIKIIRVFIKLLITILFFPFMQVFFAMLSCSQNSDNQSVLTYQSNIICWSNEHIVHGILAIFFILLFQLQINSFTLFLYEAKQSKKDTFAQKSGRQFSLYHIYISLTTMIYQLLDIPQYSFIVICAMMISSAYFYYYMKFHPPFYNRYVQIVWDIITSLNFWTNLMLCFSYLLEGNFFQQSLLSYAICIPIIILIIIKTGHSQVDLLYYNLNQCRNPNEIMKLCSYLIELSKLQHKSQNAQLLIDSYLLIHEQSCPRLDCIMKNKQLLRQISNQHQNKLIENTIILNELIYQILTFGISAQPLNIEIRLYFCFFLYDQLKQPQQALIELTQTENNSVPIDIQFIIYRYKTIIEENQMENDTSKLQFTNYLSNQNLFQQIIKQTERICIKKLELLNVLEEEKPDIAKIDGIGFKIIKLKNEIQKQWLRLQKYPSTTPQLFKIMSKYFYFVLNDDVEGNKVVQQYSTNLEIYKSEINVLEQIYHEPSPIIVIFTEQNNIGIIKDLNTATCSFLGYTKSDLFERKIQILQPEIFQKHHDQQIENYLRRQDNIKQKSERIIFIKNKQGYISQCQIQIKQLITSNQELFLIGKMRLERSHKSIGIVICSIDGTIKDINSTCIKMLKLEIQMIKMNNKNIKDIIVDIFIKMNEILTKKNVVVSIYNIQNSNNSNTINQQRSSSFKSSIVDSTIVDDFVLDEQQKLICNAQEIRFNNIDNGELQGYILKFEKIMPIQNLINQKTKKYTLIDNKQKFCFKFNATLNLFTGSYQQQIQTAHKISYENSSLFTSYDSSSKQYNLGDKKLFSTSKIGEGIRTVRLQDGRLLEIEEDENEIISEDDNVQEIFPQNDESQQELYMKKDYYFMRSKQSLTILIKTSKLPISLHILRFIITITIIGIILLTYLQFFLDLSNQQNIINSFSQFIQSNQRFSQILIVQTLIQELVILNNNNSSISSNLTEDYIRTNLQNYLDNLIIIQSQLSQIQVNLNDEFIQYEIQYYEQNVKVYQSDIIYNFTFNEVVDQIIAKGLLLSKQQLSQLTLDNNDLKFFLITTFNSIITYQFIPSQLFYYNSISIIENSKNSIQLILILAILLLFQIYILTTLFALKIKIIRDQILILILQISPNVIQQLKKNIDYFIQIIQSKDDEEDLDFEEDLRKSILQGDDNQTYLKTNDNDLESALLAKKRKRRFENTHTIIKNIIISIISIISIFEIYFIYLLIDNNSLNNSLNNILPLLNNTSIFDSYLRFGDNSLKQLKIQSDFLILFGNFSFSNLLYDIQAIENNIYILHSQETQFIDNQYIQIFNQMYLNSPCQIISSNFNSITESECNNFSDSVISYGIGLTVIKYNKYLNLAQQNDIFFKNVRMTQLLYFKISFEYLIQEQMNSITQNFSNLKVTRIALFAIFNIIILLVYVLLWIPLVKSLLVSIIKTRLLLTLLPNQYIIRNPQFMQYLLAIRSKI